MHNIIIVTTVPYRRMRTYDIMCTVKDISLVKKLLCNDKNIIVSHPIGIGRV